MIPHWFQERYQSHQAVHRENQSARKTRRGPGPRPRHLRARYRQQITVKDSSFLLFCTDQCTALKISQKCGIDTGRFDERPTNHVIATAFT